MSPLHRILNRGGVPIRYWLAGPEGAPTVILTHGATADHTTFDELVPALAERYRVLSWDMPGHGLSQPMPADFSIDRLVADQLALMDEMGWERAVLVGQSLGGNLAQEVVFRHPERVAGVALIDSTDNFQKLSILEKATVKMAGPVFGLYPFDVAKRQAAERSADTAEARRRLAAMFDRVQSKEAYIRIFVVGTDLLHYEPDYRIPVPLLMIMGEHDGLGNIARAMPAMAKREGVALVVVPGAGHVANMDRPDVVNAEVLRFLGGLPLDREPVPGH